MLKTLNITDLIVKLKTLNIIVLNVTLKTLNLIDLIVKLDIKDTQPKRLNCDTQYKRHST